MVELLRERCVVDPRPAYPLQILGTRYYVNPQATDGYTLVFLHALGMHKETWEVTISSLLKIASQRIASAQVREIISLEIPNHGESAVLNEDALKKDFDDDWHPREYTRALHLFLTAGPDKGAKIDFSKRDKLVGVGHSIGVVILLLMRDLEPRINFHSILALESGVSLKGHKEMCLSAQMLTAWTWLRRDTWQSRKNARKDLASSPVYDQWDPRVLDLYVAHGLRKHPAAKYPYPYNFNGVTTSLSRAHEAGSYRSEQLVVDAMDAYTETCKDIPIHLIWGTIHDVGTPNLHALLEDKTAGRVPASVTYVQGAGHLCVQQKPDDVAQSICDVLFSQAARL